MAIPVEHEDIEELRKWDMGLDRVIEDCFFCDLPTRYWNKKANEPCCQECAKVHSVSEFEEPT